MKKYKISVLLFFLIPVSYLAHPCSVVYYVDKYSGNIYVANHEDYWYDVDAYIQIMPNTKKEMARLWYGWDNFAQGGINEAGLFFDGAVTPEQARQAGYSKPKGNLGDEILARCKTVTEAIAYLEQKKVALNNAHMMFGDSTGNAVVVEWVNGVKKTISISDDHLTMTNFLLSDTTAGNYPCFRFASIEGRIQHLQNTNEPVTLLQVGNVLGGAAQPPLKNNENRQGGTLYSTFINITDMEFVLVYKLDNARITKLDLIQEFLVGKKRKIKLDG